MFGINKWDYFSQITRESTTWKQEDALVGGKWKIEVFQDEEEGVMETWQMHVGEYLDGSGSACIQLYPDDYSKEALLEVVDLEFTYRTKPEWVLHYSQTKLRNAESLVRHKFWDFQKKFNLGEFKTKENN